MPRFVQFLQHSGVYAEQDFMIVPRPGFNLVCLRDSKDVRLSYDRNRLQVDDVGLEDVERVALEYINFRYGKQKSQERDDQLLRLRTGLFGTAQPGPARGFKVTAKGAGTPELKATRGNISVKLDVAPSAAQGLQDRVQIPQAPRFIGQGDQRHEMDAGGRALDPHQAELDVRRSGEHFFHLGGSHAVYDLESPGAKNLARCLSKGDRTEKDRRRRSHVLSRRRL
jgi:hypothetical protein